MKRALLLVLAACGGAGDASETDAGPPSDSAGGDAGPTCSVFVTFDPPTPLAYEGGRVRATANVANAPGVLGYTWQIRRGSDGAILAHEPGALDGSAVDFLAESADSYDAIVQVAGSTGACNVTPYTVNVEAPGANTAQVRVRVYPPSSVGAPPMEKRVLVKGNAASWAVGVIPVEPGTTITGSTGAHAYVRFVPQVARDTYVETFTQPDGTFSRQLVNQLYDVLVVPLVPGFAPRLVEDWLPGEALTLGAGTAITGTVRDHDNAGLAGAKVQLVVDGVPTSLATTDASGNFSVRASRTSGSATIEVAAPASTGLPRLVATSSVWNLAQPIAITYDDALVIRDVAGAVVRRNGNALANAHVTLVGRFDAGTIGGVTATGELRASAIADGSGVLPALRAPNRVVYAVVDAGALSTLDLTSQAPSTIDAPAPAAVSTQLRNIANQPLAGAVFEAVPREWLAMAGVSATRFVADANGVAGGLLAAGARYDFVLVDPRGHEMERLAAPRTESNKTAAEVQPSYVLPKAIKVRGSLSLAGNPQPIGRGTVQVLCTSCARTSPAAEVPSATDGRFEVGVLDPGTM